MHHMDANKMHKERARWELYKNAMFYFELILEATPHKTEAVCQFTFHYKNYPSTVYKMLNNAGEARINW